MLSSCRFRDFNGSTPSTTCTSFFAMLHVCQGVICCLKAVIWGGMIDLHRPEANTNTMSVATTCSVGADWELNVLGCRSWASAQSGNNLWFFDIELIRINRINGIIARMFNWKRRYIGMLPHNNGSKWRFSLGSPTTNCNIVGGDWHLGGSQTSEVSLSSLATRTCGQEAPNAARKRQEQNLTLMAQETRLLVSRPPRPSVFRA